MRVIPLLYIVCVPGLLFGSTFVNNPRKIAQERAVQSFKAAGVLPRGIVNNVNEVQDAIGRIKKGVDETQRAIYAPRSPFSRLKRITFNLEQFQKSLQIIKKTVSAKDLQRILESEQGAQEFLKTVTDTQLKSEVRLIASIYDVLLAEMDTVMIHAILHHMRQTVYDVAGMLDTVAHIRDYAGEYADAVLSLEQVRRMREVSEALRGLARKLSEIMQGGSLSLTAKREQFAQALLDRKDSINAIIDGMHTCYSAVNDAVHKIQNDLIKITKEKNNLIRAATMMHKRLEQVLLAAHKGNDGRDLSSVASDELHAMMAGLHSPIVALLMMTADLMNKIVQGMKEGLAGINLFKAELDFDVVNPVVRLDLDALPKLTRELSRSITQLRGVLV